MHTKISVKRIDKVDFVVLKVDFGRVVVQRVVVLDFGVVTNVAVGVVVAPSVDGIYLIEVGVIVSVG